MRLQDETNMKLTEYISEILRAPRKKKNVALALSGGGARGYAHIGAIEVLLQRGYLITSVAGTSMGALVGGLFAAGKLDEMKDRVLNLNKKEVLSLMNISLGLDHVASGERLMASIDEMVGESLIEALPINFCCCASDVVSGKEKVFREGSLKTAIRASISIPCFFKPVSDGTHIYVDGSVHNTLPLDRVMRHKGDLLVAVNVSAPDDESFDAYLKPHNQYNNTENSLLSRLPFMKYRFSANYMNMALRVARLSIQNNTQMSIRLTPPDVCASIPMNRFSLFDLDKAADIIQYGRDEMSRQLDAFEKNV